jgi:NADH-quinone oxidoreductase subunit M
MIAGIDTAGGIVVGAAAMVAAPLAGAIVVVSRAGRAAPRSVAVVASMAALAIGLVLAGLWEAGDATAIARGHSLDGGSLFFVDGFTLVMLPYVLLVASAIVLVAPRRALDEAAVVRSLVGVAATVAMFLTSHPVALVVLWIATLLPTWWSTRATPGGGPAARVFAAYMGLATVFMVTGTALLVADPPWERASGLVGTVGGWLVAFAVMIRKGIWPFHSWYPALFSGAPMSTALSATMPQVGAYTAVRLLVGHADGVAHELEMLTLFALVTAVYGAALALVQRDLRGFIGVLAMSQSALVLAGLSGRVPLELDGAFCLWISSGLAITGIGLVSWAIESRAGPVPIDSLQGRFRDAPELAAFFLLFGMSAIGLPGTLSFVADDLMVSGSVDDHVGAGLMVIASTVLCGIAVMRCWFHVFGGRQPVDSPRHGILRRERASLSVLLATLFGLGLWPGPLVRALDRAAAGVLRDGTADPATMPPDGDHP